MPHVSRREIKKETKKLFDSALIHALTNLDKSELISIIHTLFTKTETKMIRKRIAIIFLGEQGIPQEEIAELTKTTRQTVARIQADLSLVDQKHQEFIRSRLQKFAAKQKIKNTITALLSKDISRSGFKRKVSPF